MEAPENAGGGGSTSGPAQHPGAVHEEAEDLSGPFSRIKQMRSVS